MNIFNYRFYVEKKQEDQINKIIANLWGSDFIKTAMGATRMQFRDQYQWWDLEDIVEKKPDSWKEQLEIVPSLKDVLMDARAKRRSAINDVSVNFNLPLATASRMVKTYIGFHPAYGAYSCQLGPYVSEGFVHGREHVVKSAEGRYGYFVLKYNKATPEEISKALTKNIIKYNNTYDVQLQEDDFDLMVKEHREEPRGEKNWGYADKPAMKVNMNPNNPVFKEFFNLTPECSECHSNQVVVGKDETQGECKVCGAQVDLSEKGQGPMLPGDAAKLTINGKGYLKLLRGFFGDKYDEALAELSALRGKTPQEIVQLLVSGSEDLLNEVYTLANRRYDLAKARGEIAETGKVPPPRFTDRSLRTAPGKGQIGYSKIKTTKEMQDSLEFTKTILGYMERGIVDSEQIAQELNNIPERVVFNRNRERANEARKRQGLSPLPMANFTADGIQLHLDIIESQRDKIGQNATFAQIRDAIDNLIRNTFSVDPTNNQPMLDEAGEPIKQYGYDDMSTAYQMAKLYFSSVARDGITKVPVGVPNAIAFNPPENLHNFTTQDLAKSKEAPKLTEEQRKAQPEELEKELGQLPDVGQKLVDPVLEEVPLAEKERGLLEELQETPKPVVEPVELGELPLSPQEQKMREEEDKKKQQQEMEDLIGRTVGNLIKVASELDNEGKSEASEEIHKIIRKYKARVF